MGYRWARVGMPIAEQAGMLRGLVSVLLALILVAVQVALVSMVAGCDLDDGEGDDIADAAVIAPDGRVVDAATGPAFDGSTVDAQLPLCGFGASPRLTMDGTTFPVTIEAEPQALGCCDGVKLRFRHDRPGTTGEEFAIELTLLAEGGWGTLPRQFDLSADNNMLRKTLQWKCNGSGCVPNDTAVSRSFSGEFHVARRSDGKLEGTLCGRLVDVDNAHPVFQTIDMYATFVPFSF